MGELILAKGAAKLLGVQPTKINQFVRDNDLVTVSRNGRAYVPAGLLRELSDDEALLARAFAAEEENPLPPATHALKENLRGTITLLRDGGFSSEEVAAWLWAPNEELGDPPIVALGEGGHHRVNRIAATLAW